MILDPTQDQAELAKLLSESPKSGEDLLPILQQVQKARGFISEDAIKQIAAAFNLSRAEVYGVVSFYTDLRQAPVGKHVIQLCMAEACQSVGCRELASYASRKLGVEVGKTTADGNIHLEAAYCFGNCALGPSVRIGDSIIGRVTPQVFDELIAGLGKRDDGSNGAMQS